MGKREIENRSFSQGEYLQANQMVCGPSADISGDKFQTVREPSLMVVCSLVGQNIFLQTVCGASANHPQGRASVNLPQGGASADRLVRSGYLPLGVNLCLNWAVQKQPCI